MLLRVVFVSIAALAAASVVDRPQKAPDFNANFENEAIFPEDLKDHPDTLKNFLYRVYRSPTHTRRTVASGQRLLLSPYIERGELEEARKAAYVDPNAILPGLDSYAGYLTVDKKYNSNLWFWYFPVADKPIESTPWIIWLQGGPGVSSLYGLFTEIGPIAVRQDGSVEEIEYNWGKNHSLLFIDNPVGTGFSFTEDDRGYATNQTTIGEQLYDALQQFLTLFPELRKAPLIIAGESYAGKHIPSLGIQIHWHKNCDNRPINLQGLAIGNGFIDPASVQHYSTFAREVGLIDDHVADQIAPIEKAIVTAIEKGELMRAKKLYDTLTTTLKIHAHLGNIYNYEQDVQTNASHTSFIENDEVRAALHVGDTNFTHIGVVYDKLEPDFMNSAKPWLEELLQNYRIMCYSGSLDVAVPYRISVNTHMSLKAEVAPGYYASVRRFWFHNGKLAGYYKQAGNLTEVMVRRAGHMVPTDAPAPALGLISAFARSISLEQDTGPLAQPSRTLHRRKLPDHYNLE